MKGQSTWVSESRPPAVQSHARSAGGDQTMPGSTWPSLPGGREPWQVATLCQAIWERSAPEDSQMPSSEVPASRCATLLPAGPGVRSGSGRCPHSAPRPTHRVPGQRVDVLPRPRRWALPQPSPCKPGLGSPRQVSWGPSHANLHQQVGRRAFPNRGA